MKLSAQSGSLASSIVTAGIAVFSLAVLCPETLRAGSVFMKNGYIIQGPIIERSEGSVVMGWSNGKVVIHERFIDSVTLDQTEEKRLAEDRQFKEANEEGGPFLLDTAPEVEGADALPVDLDSLMHSLAREGTPVDPSAGGVKAPAGDGAGLTTAVVDPETSVAVVPPPADSLGERVKDERSGASIRPPSGWQVVASELAFVVRGPALPEGFEPSLNLVSGPRAGLDSTDYAGFLKDEMAKVLDGFELVNEGSIDIQGIKAYQAVGRGAHQGRSAWVRQALLVSANDWWLLSAFLPATGADSLHAAVEECFKTLELSSR